MSLLKSMYSPALDVAWPFIVLGLIAVLSFRSIRIPRWRDIPSWTTALALLIVWTFHWIGWELGVVDGDEVAHFLSTGWTFDLYVRSDSGMPSRTYLTVSWFLLHWQGLAGVRLFMLLCATATTLVVMACFRKIHHRWGPVAALPLLFYYPWLRYTWETRAYSLFFLAVCLALWHALQHLDTAEKPPRLAGVLLWVSIASIENPIALLIAFAAIQSKVRRWGWASITRRTWLLLALLVMMVFPLVVKAIGVHTQPSQTHDLSVDPWLLVLLAISIPGATKLGRKGWVAETALGTLILLLVGQATGVVPGDHRVLLFVVPWSFAALLVWIRPGWWERPRLFPAIVTLILSVDLLYLGLRVSQWSNSVTAAQAVYFTLTEVGAKRVRFAPNHMRLFFLSASVDVRHIRNRYFDQFHPDIPKGYRSKASPSCEAGEFVVEWQREQPVCDCPRIADQYPWRAYHCEPPAAAQKE